MAMDENSPPAGIFSHTRDSPNAPCEILAFLATAETLATCLHSASNPSIRSLKSLTNHGLNDGPTGLWVFDEM